MATPVTGECRPLADGRFEARIRIDDQGNRKGFALVTIPRGDEASAKERTRAMAELALRLRRAGYTGKVIETMKMAAKARAGKYWAAIVSGVQILCDGHASDAADGPAPLTVRELGRQWREGELHRRFPDHVPVKKPSSVRRDGMVARPYVDPEIGDTLVADLTLDDCERVMASLPEGRSSSSRRHVAGYMRRLLVFAVYPLRLRTDNPIPKGWLPKIRDGKAKELLLPAEDRALLGCTETPLLRRLSCGVCAREGGRADEMLASIKWRDIDLEHGRIELDHNKTDDPRGWILDPGVTRALRTWKERYHPNAGPDDYVFAENGVPINVKRLAEQLRRDLKRAGVTRPQLFERSAVRRPIRAHDLRATFVTIALATGKTETWVADRTGHKSSTMINRYRRKARAWNLGELDALDQAIPELRPAPHERPMVPPTLSDSADLSSGNGGGSAGVGFAAVSSRDLNPLRLPFRHPCLDVDLTAESSKLAGASAASVNSAPHEHGALPGALDGPQAVERALCRALEAAATAGRFDVVAALAKELESRRLAGTNVTPLDARTRRGR